MPRYNQVIVKCFLVMGGAAAGCIAAQGLEIHALIPAMVGAAMALAGYHWEDQQEKKIRREAEFYCLAYGIVVAHYGKDAWTFVEFRRFVEGFVTFMKRGSTVAEAEEQAYKLLRKEA